MDNTLTSHVLFGLSPRPVGAYNFRGGGASAVGSGPLQCSGSVAGSVAGIRPLLSMGYCRTLHRYADFTLTRIRTRARMRERVNSRSGVAFLSISLKRNRNNRYKTRYTAATPVALAAKALKTLKKGVF